MKSLRGIFLLTTCWLGFSCELRAQLMDYKIDHIGPGEGEIQFDYRKNIATGTNGVMVRYGGAVLTANTVTYYRDSGLVVAEGGVRLQRDNQTWVSQRISYNFVTKEIESDQFHTGKAPVFASGESLRADLTNKVYIARQAFITTEDLAEPDIKVRADSIRIYGDRIEARHAMLYVDGVPLFYFPYYTRSLAPRANNFNFVPGYRSKFGPYLLSSYHWFLKEQLDGIIHLDWREKRGLAGGPDFNWQLGRWGEGGLKYYYAHDHDPNIDLPAGTSLPHDRQRLDFTWQAEPFTNFETKAVVRYQSDTNFVRDFLETEYRHNPQPSTFIEANKFWQNFSLDTYVQPRVNDFLETVERLPEVRLTGFRQELGPTPIYYESQSSIGYYRRLFAETNSLPTGMDYEAARADTYHQLLLPYTFFGWLDVTPRAGGRFTWYSHASGPGATTDEQYRGVFNTGAEVSFKASRVWPTLQSGALELDGLRHIIQPSVNYAYVPRPNRFGTNEIPQFDYELASLRMLPIEFPSYNSIDSIDSENVLRLGLGNRLQTKRLGEVVNFVDWQLYTDWRLKPHDAQTTFSDLFSDMTIKPRSWLTIESLIRYEINSGLWRMAFHQFTFQPAQTWNWSIGHFYVRDDPTTGPTSLGIGNNLITSTMFYRVNEDWCLRAAHRFEARDGRMEEQAYSIYRDMRSWTAALTFRVLENETGPRDYTIAFTFSLKAFPRFGLGTDIARPYSLLGG
ncbi:MAG: hypothetical protein C5B50_30205 [Verrucomicrobia bacterium]|nr:MAG: hypothetical protein C5B50_30205 [Verrucomicrobiota bacterium]